MKFFSLESSKKLAEMGCVTDGFFYYFEGNVVSPKPPEWSTLYEPDPAFTPFDFLSSEEYAIENCRKLWGEECVNRKPCPVCDEDTMSKEYYYEWYYYKHFMLEAPDQIKFVEEFL